MVYPMQAMKVYQDIANLVNNHKMDISKVFGILGTKCSFNGGHCNSLQD